MVKILLKILVVLAYLISMAMVIDQVGVRLASFLVPVGFAVFAFALPQRFNKLKLLFTLSAAVWVGVGAVATFWGASVAATVMIPLSLVFLIVAIRMMLDQPRPRPDWLWLMISAILSGAFTFAMFTYGTLLAANRWALFVALILGIILLIRRRPVPVWIVGVLLITSLFPIVIMSTNLSRNEKIERTAKLIIFSNPTSTSKELTRMFYRKAKPILRKGEKFSGNIKRKATGDYEVSYDICISSTDYLMRGTGGGFYVPSP